MSPGDIIYVALLVFSLLFGHVVKYTRYGKPKQFLCAFVGVLMVVIVCREHAFHSLVTAVVNCLLICIIPARYCHIVSFIWCFGYLTFFRTCHFIGLPKPSPHSNAVQLLLTLKMIALAFEVNDTAKLKKQAEVEKLNSKSEGQLQLELKYRGINPSFVDTILYSYCYIGLLTGPFFKYRTYHDSMFNKHTAMLSTIEPMWKRIKVLPLYAAFYFLLEYYFPFTYIEEDEFFTRPLWFRWFYGFTSFTWFRSRIYSAWILSECLCMTAGFGVYPVVSKPKCGQGPTYLQALDAIEESRYLKHVEHSFETIHNINEYGCDFCASVREGMRSWNMTVQYWMATYVYRRVPNKFIGTYATLLVSSYWHGIHPGYFLSFASIPLALMAEDAMIKAFRKQSTSERRKQIFDWFSWFFAMRTFDYLSIAFLLLQYEPTVRYWKSVYYYVHVVIAALIVMGKLGSLFSSSQVKTKSA